MSGLGLVKLLSDNLKRKEERKAENSFQRGTCFRNYFAKINRMPTFEKHHYCQNQMHFSKYYLLLLLYILFYLVIIQTFRSCHHSYANETMGGGYVVHSIDITVY